MKYLILHLVMIMQKIFKVMKLDRDSVVIVIFISNVINSE